MTKINIPNQKNEYRALNGRMVRYVVSVMKVYEKASKKASDIAITAGYDGIKPFRFSEYPSLKSRVSKIQSELASDLNAIIIAGTSNEWKKSNLVQDLLVNGTLKSYGVKRGDKKYKKYYQTNSEALKAFQKRRINGLSLSQNIWNQSKEAMTELEYCISNGIQKGMSATTLSKKVSKYLLDYDSIKKDYKEKYGIKATPKNMEYRSIRLARSEISMAYRSAEQERWSQFDFVIGKEIKVSGGLDTGVLKSRHKPDICDDLQGKYPKDFFWLGWHPNCMCYEIPVLKSKEAFFGDDDDDDTITYPKVFGDWIDRNYERIVQADNNNTLPYFIKKNERVRDCALLIGKAHGIGDVLQTTALNIAEKHKGLVTPINYKGFNSLYRKLETEAGKLSEIKDVVRNTIIVPRNEIEGVLAELRKSPNTIRIKVQDFSDTNGYTGYIVNQKINGVVGEIQVNTPMMIYAKEAEPIARKILGDSLWEYIYSKKKLEGGLGHALYEKIRVLKNDEGALNILLKKSREYYGHFYDDVNKKYWDKVLLLQKK